MNIGAIGTPDFISSIWNSGGQSPFSSIAVMPSVDVVSIGNIENGNAPRYLMDSISSPTGSGSAKIGSLDFSVNFGRAANEDVDLASQFSVYAQTDENQSQVRR